MILAPSVRPKAQKDEEIPEEISRPIAGFRATFVFDISQTDGKDLSRISVVAGDPSDYSDRLRRFASAQNITVEYSEEMEVVRQSTEDQGEAQLCSSNSRVSSDSGRVSAEHA